MSDLIPSAYDELNIYNSRLSPSTVHVKNSTLAQFFKRYLLQEAMSVFTWDLPETWDRAYFLYVLYVWGYITISDFPGFGVIPQHGFFGGYNVFYAPKYMVVSNPLFKESYQLDIDKDCIVLRLSPDYRGLYDIVDYYGDMMALTAESVGINLLNTRLSYVFLSRDKAGAESFKKLYDRLSAGNPAAFADEKLLGDDGKLQVSFLNQNVSESFIVPELLDSLKAIKCMFLTDVGIPNTNIVKESGVTAQEVAANNMETRAKCSLWLDELQKGCRKARDMYGVDLSVDWRNDLKEVMSDAGDAFVADRDL